MLRYLRSVVPTTELLEGRTGTDDIIGRPPKDCGFMVEETACLTVEATWDWRTGVLKATGIA